MAKDTVWVRSGLVEPRVALSERDPMHPGGEAWVAGSVSPTGEVERKAVEVGRTALVEQKIRSGELVEVEGPSRDERADAREAAERIEGAVPVEPTVVGVGDPLTPEARAAAAEVAAEDAQADARTARRTR